MSTISSQEVVLRISAEDVALTSRLLTHLRDAQIVSSVRATPQKPDLRQLADYICATRRERSRAFSEHLVSDLAWDMLVALYCANETGEELSITSLIFTAEVPQTTGLRWVRSLQTAGLIVTTPHSTDRRRVLVSLSDDGHSRVERCLALSARRL